MSWQPQQQNIVTQILQLIQQTFNPGYTNWPSNASGLPGPSIVTAPPAQPSAPWIDPSMFPFTPRANQVPRPANGLSPTIGHSHNLLAGTVFGLGNPQIPNPLPGNLPPSVANAGPYNLPAHPAGPLGPGAQWLEQLRIVIPQRI